MVGQPIFWLAFFVDFLLHNSMALISYKEWQAKMQESSAFTRKRTEVARGLKPPMADFMSHSTPPPGQMKALKKKSKKKR